MAYLAVNKNGSERIFDSECTHREPERKGSCIIEDRYDWGINHGYTQPYYWCIKDYEYNNEDTGIPLPKGTIEKIIGKKLTWEDNFVKI